MVFTHLIRNRELLYGLLGADSESDAIHESTFKKSLVPHFCDRIQPGCQWL